MDFCGFAFVPCGQAKLESYRLLRICPWVLIKFEPLPLDGALIIGPPLTYILQRSDLHDQTL
jgi:hypothetical protein